MGSLIGHRIDYNGVGERLATHTQQKLTQVTPPPPGFNFESKPFSSADFSLQVSSLDARIALKKSRYEIEFKIATVLAGHHVPCVDSVLSANNPSREYSGLGISWLDMYSDLRHNRKPIGQAKMREIEETSRLSKLKIIGESP